MVDSRAVLTADECFQEARMSRGCVYRLWGLLWVRVLWNVTQSVPHPTQDREEGFTVECERNSHLQKPKFIRGLYIQPSCLTSHFIHGVYFGTDSHVWVTFLSVWGQDAENNREEKNLSPIKQECGSVKLENWQQQEKNLKLFQIHFFWSGSISSYVLLALIFSLSGRSSAGANCSETTIF